MGVFKSDGKDIYLDASYCEFYIPKSYFENNSFAENLGSTIKVLGVFDVGIFENGKLKEIKCLNLPTWIDINVYDSEMTDVQLPNSDTPITCDVIKYSKGHKIMSASLVEDSVNVESYLDFVGKGKIPSNIPYSKSITLWLKNQEINGVSLGVPSVILEMILANAYRYKNDPTMKFSSVIGTDKKVSEYDYVMSNFRQICQYASTFTGLTFEDMDAMITTSLNRTINKSEEAYSPVEEIIKM